MKASDLIGSNMSKGWICNQLDKLLWEHDRKYQMAGEEIPFRTVVFRPDAHASFCREISCTQFMAAEGVTQIDTYRGATIGVVHDQTETFRVVER